MSTREKIQQRLKLARPVLRARARPPKQRSHLGGQFSAANLNAALVLQVCGDCGHMQYPPTELCGACLGDTLVFESVETGGTLLARSDLHNSLWEFFKRRLRDKPWPMGSVQLDVGPVLLVHLASPSLSPGDRVSVFSHTDASQSMVLLAVEAGVAIETAEQRAALASAMGLTAPAERPDGI